MTAFRALGLLALVAVTACTDRAPVVKPTPLVPCTVPGIGREAECGVIQVPEVRGADETMGLRVVRVRARRSGVPREALTLLAGGPGQAGSEAFARLWPIYASIAEGRDVLLVDARGTGGSAPLDCPPDDDLADAFRVGTLTAAARRCAPRHAGRVLDAYGTDSHAADLEEVRRAFEYERLDLLGVSYGTRLALAYAQAHPTRVRSLVLDGVVPPELVLGATFGRDADAALDGVLADCDADEGCRRAFPEARAALAKHLASLDASVIETDVRQPETQAALRVRVERAGFVAALRGLLYAPELAALLPLTLAEAEAGRYDGLFGQTATLARAAEEGMSLGLLFSVACAEDVPRITESDRDAERATRLGVFVLDDLRQACAVWPVKPRPLEASSSVLDVPTLLLSGARDPATPPRFADALRERLPRSMHVIVPEAAHGVWARGCVPTIVEQFLERGTADGLEVECVARHRRPPFFLGRGGPAP